MSESRLIDGYRRFRDNGWIRDRELWKALAEGQSPKVMVISCSDSRVDPAQVFNTSPGEIFVVRNVANFVPARAEPGTLDSVSPALEFAVTKLGVEEILVLGHESCGGCAAALTGMFEGAQPGEGGYVGGWAEQLYPAREKVQPAGSERAPEEYRAMEQEVVKLSLANLRTYPWIAEREADGRLRLAGARFSIANGELSVLDEAEGNFRPA